MPLKILVVTNLFPTDWRPYQGAFNRQQLERLSKRHSLEIFVPVSWIDWLGGRKGNSSTPIPVYPFVYFYTPRFWRSLYSTYMLASLLAHRRRLVMQGTPDCIFASWAYPDAVVGAVLARLLNVPVVIKVHGSDINSYTEYLLRRKQILWSMRKAHAVVAVSASLKQRLVDIGVTPEKIRVIYNGVDHAVFHALEEPSAVASANDDKRRRIVYVGNLKKDKGCADLMNAFVTLAKRRDDIDLYFIGTGPARSALEKSAPADVLRRHIHFTGALDHNAVARHIAEATVLCLPSYNEGVPNVILEAMACGTPVVATRVGGVPEVVDSGTGIMIDPGRCDELINALDRALSIPWNRQAIARQSRRFSWEENISALDRLLEEAVLAYDARGKRLIPTKK